MCEMKTLQWYGHVKRMQDERLPKLIIEWITGERRKRGRPRKTWMEGARAAMKTRHLEADQWLNRKEWCLGSGRRRQLSQDRKDRLTMCDVILQYDGYILVTILSSTSQKSQNFYHRARHCAFSNFSRNVALQTTHSVDTTTLLQAVSLSYLHRRHNSSIKSTNGNNIKTTDMCVVTKQRQLTSVRPANRCVFSWSDGSYNFVL